MVDLRLVPDQRFKITSLWAFVADDPEQGEGLVAYSSSEMGGAVLPAIGADQTRVEDLLPMMSDLAKQVSFPITLVQFTVREDIEVVK